ncbi:MAG: membrane protein insertase YidC [Deltaproteobacteria bacterium]|nr:MAG: membrane protein insertase YidC [Deltaproteobacteria bacterium]
MRGPAVSTQVRFVLTIVLSLAILTVYGMLRPRPAELPKAETPAVAADEGAGSASPGDGAAEGGAPAEQAPVDAAPVESTPDEVPARHDAIRTELLALDLSNQAVGVRGLVEHVRLLSPQFADHPTGEDPFDLGNAGTFAIAVYDREAEAPAIAKTGGFRVLEATASRYVAERTEDGIRTEVRLEALDGYEGRLEIVVENRRSRPFEHHLELVTRIGVGESRYDVRRGLCRTGEDLEEIESDDVEEAPVRVRGDVRWGGSDGKYFTSLIVGEAAFASCEVTRNEAGDRLQTTLRTEGVVSQPGARAVYRFGWYVGAKELERLQAFAAVDLKEGSLEEAIEWGYLGAVSEGLGKVLLRLLRWIHGWAGSWGLSILLLTVMVKLVTLPLTLKQMASMRRMKEIQPEINRIKEKYADDRVRQGQELQALFARSGVHPLAGCLPMLIQIPVWFALYSMLLSAVELVHQPFLWLPDLTTQDPYFVLPVAIGGAMYLQNRMMPNTMDEAQAKMMRTIMPVMFTAIMLFLPAGLGVYILTNIVLSVLQTAIQMRSKTDAEPASA